jgi:hypothetical protein
MQNMTISRAAIAASLLALALFSAPVSAASSSVERACAGDYFAYCSQHSPESSGVRSCMRSNGSRLSDRCVKALVAAGEVSSSAVSKKTARR